MPFGFTVFPLIEIASRVGAQRIDWGLSALSAEAVAASERLDATPLLCSRDVGSHTVAAVDALGLRHQEVRHCG